MKWNEIIHILASEERIKRLLQTLPKELEATMEAEQENLVDIQLMHNSVFKSNLAVVLIWQSNNTPSKSKLGFLLSDRLSSDGMIDHSIWNLHEIHCNPTN